MQAFGTKDNVSTAVDLVNSANPPEWMLTFNEPDLSYGGLTPTMTPEEAASAIEPLLDRPGHKTRYVAPVTANATSDWLPRFSKACNCQNFFSAYNVHAKSSTTSAPFVPSTTTTLSGSQKWLPVKSSQYALSDRVMCRNS